MKKLIARDEYGYKVNLTQDRGMWVNHDGLSYARDGSILMLNGEHSTHDLTIISEEVETESGTLTTTVGPWLTDGGTVTIPWDVSMTPVYAAGPLRGYKNWPKFDHPETREDLYDWIIQAAVDGKIKRCDHHVASNCPACHGVGWVLK